MQANEDKEMLIESMRKLTSHISNNVKRQSDIFNSLSLPDLQKIIYNLHDSNQNLRKISALLLCEMAYKSQQIKKRMAELLKLYPCEGRICLGGLPNLIANFPMAIKSCLNLMKIPLEQGQSQKFCWFINLDQKNVKIQFMDFKTYPPNTFIDPRRTLFGITIISIKKSDRISPLRDKNQSNIAVPSRMSFNSNHYNRLNETFKSKQAKQRISIQQRDINTDRIKGDKNKRDKIISLFQQKKGRLYTQQ